MDATFSVGVHALVYLNHKQQCLTSEQLAENVCTNPARIRKVMAKLKKAGLVATHEGAGGGYCFDKDAKAVTLAAVARALDITFVQAAWRSGDADMDCLVASGMADIMENLYEVLNCDCYKRLESISIADIDAKIFTK